MAGDWFPMRVDLHDDPAVIAIAFSTGLDQHGVVGRLHRLWSWASTQLTDGVAKGVTVDWVDKHVSAAGFAAAMLEVGWLQSRSGSIVIPRFDTWMSQSCKARLLASQRKKRERVSKVSRPKRDKNATTEQRTGQDSKDKEREVSDSIGDPIQKPDQTTVERPAVDVNAASREVSQAYRTRVTSFHSSTGLPEIRNLLSDGVPKADLMNAVDGYAADCRRLDKEARVRLSAGRFFGEEAWKGFVAGAPPPIAKAATPAELAEKNRQASSHLPR